MTTPSSSAQTYAWYSSGHPLGIDGPEFVATSGLLPLHARNRRSVHSESRYERDVLQLVLQMIPDLHHRVLLPTRSENQVPLSPDSS